MEGGGSGAGGGLGGAAAQGGVHVLDMGSGSEQDEDELMRVLCPDEEEGEQQGKGDRQKAAIGGEVGVTEGDDLVKAQSSFLSVFGL